jgi:serine/threonine protein kinase
VDGRTDLYALGAVGYWLLTGTHVFGGKSILEVCAQHLHSVPEAPSDRLGAPVSADLESVILACLAKRPDDRPASAQILRERLAACAAAGRWTNARGTEWWSKNRDRLRSSKTSKTAGAASGAMSASASQLTITRIAD